MIKRLKLTKRIIICFIVSCFISVLGITTTYALNLDGIKTVEELTAVRAAGKNINDNNDDFVNGKRTNEKSLLTFTGGFTTNDNEKYTTNFGERRDRDGVLQVPETYKASDRNANSDPSWINRTVLINNLGNSTLQVYLAQGNVARTSTVSSNYDAKEKANKMFLAWQRFANGATEGAVPNNSTAWYNSNLSILYKFNNYTGDTAVTDATARKNKGYTKGIQFVDTNNNSVSYIQPTSVFSSAALVSGAIPENQINGYKLNIRMPIYSLTPYIRLTNLKDAKDGYALIGLGLSYYNNANSYIVNAPNTNTSASTTMYVDDDLNSIIVYAGLQSQLAAINGQYNPHAYTFRFNYNNHKINGDGLPIKNDTTIEADTVNKTKYWDMGVDSVITKNTRIAPSTDSDLKKKGYTLKGWYTQKEGGYNIFDEYGHPVVDNQSSSYWQTYGDNNHCIFMQKHNAKYLNSISGISEKSNLADSSTTYVYAYDKDGNKIGTMNMYAQWEPIKYKVQYKYNNRQDDVNDSQPSNPTEWVYGVSQTIKAPTRRGYTFAGWTVKNGDVESLPAGDVTTSNLTSVNNRTVTLVAKWTPNTYKITFHSNYPGNKKAEEVRTWEIEYDKDTNATSYAPTFTYTDYHMTDYKSGNVSYYEWTQNNPAGEFYQNYMARTANNKWWNSEQNNAYKIWYDIDVYASWAKNQYTIVYDSNDGTAVENQIAYSGDDTILKAGPTREGYTFLGWSVYNYYGNAVDQSGRAAIYPNILLKIQFVQSIYIIEIKVVGTQYMKIRWRQIMVLFIDRLGI